MKGLILKDFLNLKKQAYLYLMLFVLFAGISLVSKDVSFLLFMGAVFSAMTVMSAMYYDEKSNWDKFALTTTVTRSQLALSKYVLGGIVLLATAVVETIILSVIGQASVENFLILGAMAATGIALLAVIVPLLIRFGVEKGRVVLVVLAAVFVGLGMLLGKYFKSLFAVNPAVLYILMPAVACLLLGLSIWASIAIYRKKEF